MNLPTFQLLAGCLERSLSSGKSEESGEDLDQAKGDSSRPLYFETCLSTVLNVLKLICWHSVTAKDSVKLGD